MSILQTPQQKAQEERAAADKKAFSEWLDFNFDWEGRVYEDVPGDAGGPTKWGVTWIDANVYLAARGRARYSIESARKSRMSYLTKDDIYTIYQSHYWDAINGQKLPSPTDQVLADLAVNCGVGRAIQFAAQTTGIKNVRGGFSGPLLDAVLGYIHVHGQETFVAAINTRRQAFYDRLGAPGKRNSKFLRGWTNRVKALVAFAKTRFPKKSVG